jgi:HAD superfamily hydrolase (TIGR01509 family)
MAVAAAPASATEVAGEGDPTVAAPLTSDSLRALSTPLAASGVPSRGHDATLSAYSVWQVGQARIAFTLFRDPSLTPVGPTCQIASVQDSPSDPPASPATSAAIFDLDGTLADTMPVHYRVWTELAPRYGLTFPEERFYSMGGVPTVKIAATLAAEQNLPIDAVALAREKEQTVLLRVGEVLAIEPVVEIARAARAAGQPIAIASGGSRAMVERTLRQIGLYDWFPVIVTAEDTARHKPEPDVFLEAARRLGVAPAICTVYEDTDLGLEAARRAGMRGVDVRPLYVQRRLTAPT